MNYLIKFNDKEIEYNFILVVEHNTISIWDHENQVFNFQYDFNTNRFRIKFEQQMFFTLDDENHFKRLMYNFKSKKLNPLEIFIKSYIGDLIKDEKAQELVLSMGDIHITISYDNIEISTMEEILSVSFQWNIEHNN